MASGLTPAGWSGVEAAVSGNGTLVYLQQASPVLDRTLVWVDLTGKESPLPLLPGTYQPLDLSHDGKQLLLTRYDQAEDTWSLWTCELASGAWTRRAGGSSLPVNAIWSPDDHEIVYTSDHDGRQFQNLFRQLAAKPDGGESLTQAEYGQYPQSWSPDGQTIAFAEGQHPATGADILLLSMAGDRRPRIAVQSPRGDYQATFSPGWPVVGPHFVDVG